MWTPGQYIDTWKRPEMLSLRIVLLCVMCLASACVVTDEIEFHDKINLPPQLDSVVPVDDKIDTIANNSEKSYTVTVWDPDEYDGSDYRGYVTVIAQMNSGPKSLWSNNCESTELFAPDPDKYEGGIMVTLKCNAVFQLKNAPEKTTVIIQVIVSDRAVRSDPEAKSVQVTWTGELYPGNAE